jgi:AP2 domain
VLYKVKLKNADEWVLMDAPVYEFLTTDPYLVEVDFINNLRRHSSGCAVFQKTWKKADGGYKTETIYLHKLIAEKFLGADKSKERNLVGAKNGNKLDCRLENVLYRSRSVASRKRKTSSKAGYTGVYKENNRFRAVISVNRKSMHIGMFATAEEAALAYNKMSKKLYGDDGKLNVIKSSRKGGDDEPTVADLSQAIEVISDAPRQKRGRKKKIQP